MLVRLFSDIHQEIKTEKIKQNSLESLKQTLWHPIPLDTDKDTTLILAGDVWSKYSAIKYGNYGYSWLGELSKQFKYVVMVYGNHDYWGGHLSKVKKFQAKIKESFDNVFLLEKDSVVLDDHKFIGATLWANIPSDVERDYLRQLTSRTGKQNNDFNHIRAGTQYRRFNIRDYNEINSLSVQYVKNEIEKSDLPVVVVSHHAPLRKAYQFYDPELPEFFQYFDTNDLESYLLEPDVQTKVKFWGFGHIHYSQIHQIGKMTVANNAVGYTHLTENYNEISLFEL